MRWKASRDAGLKEVWIDIAEGLSDEQKEEFIVKDNVNYGEWEWDILANEWDSIKLDEWGLGVWKNEDDIEEPNFKQSTEDSNNKPPTLKITFDNQNDLQDAKKKILKIISKYEKAYLKK